MRLCDRLEGVDPGRERWTGRQDPDPGGAYIRLGGGGEREAETRPRTLLSPIAAEVRDSGEAATVLAPSFPRWCSSTEREGGLVHSEERDHRPRQQERVSMTRGSDPATVL